MEPEEITLRLMAVNGVYGDDLAALARFLRQSAAVAPDTLRCAGLSAAQVAQFYAPGDGVLAQARRWLSQPGRHLLTCDQPGYPAALRAISDYPVALFVEGDIAALSVPQIAIVGSRAHSWYGARWGRFFSEWLAGRGITITSGLALGIDAVAHRGALNAGGKTIAVLGNGLLRTYPRRHAALSAQIVDAGGALVSEFPLATSPWPGNFPRRNRLISGLSLGVLVVEAMLKSGSLVTARCALEQGREVFALPGPIGNPGSQGPHFLLKQGATPATSPEDVLENLQSTLHWLPDAAEKTINSPERQFAPLPFPELLANVGDEVTPVDVVAERAGQPVPVTVAQLLELELAGWIAAVPGGYVRLRRACHVRRTDVFV